ncbi:proline rich transmembrane protein 1B [Alligator mississippiensis]|uniref:Proline-rich transmembrane protein 1-like n=1 Tax=Alligator mississippiensis TaxID=8496 RepID=A0A151NGF8_ALLMI|nr:proline rich transmembrane protein 1B [Alligator mississippiensis]KYO35739.1 proline-rich transmembrane protein 1-like [Alligator mississippiensis]
MDVESRVPYAPLEQPPVRSYKWWSIGNILCCCLPLGLVAVYYSGQVEECLARRDIAGAKKASDTAKTINILALVIGLACIGFMIFYMVRNAQLIKSMATQTIKPPY